MKMRVLFRFEKMFAMPLALLGLALAAQAGPTTPAAAPAKAGSGPVEACIPKSVFAIPSAPKDGKDPFFPRSMRPYSMPVLVVTNATAPVVPNVVAEVKLQGFSGPPEHRLAIINNHTFETGEEAEIVTNVGRTRVRLISIKENAALVQVGGEQRELRLRSGI
jgi:hypothetical protein